MSSRWVKFLYSVTARSSYNLLIACSHHSLWELQIFGDCSTPTKSLWLSFLPTLFPQFSCFSYIVKLRLMTCHISLLELPPFHFLAASFVLFPWPPPPQLCYSSENFPMGRVSLDYIFLGCPNLPIILPRVFHLILKQVGFALLTVSFCW